MVITQFLRMMRRQKPLDTIAVCIKNNVMTTSELIILLIPWSLNTYIKSKKIAGVVNIFGQFSLKIKLVLQAMGLRRLDLALHWELGLGLCRRRDQGVFTVHWSTGWRLVWLVSDHVDYLSVRQSCNQESTRIANLVRLCRVRGSLITS